MKIKILLKHINTIMNHRKYVRKSCFKMGLYWQGLIHDLSKYSLTELSVCKYYTGVGSPHNECRNKTGYSKSWLHHKYKNKHHWQYWLDDKEEGGFVPIKMPYKYVIESICDFVGAGKAYSKEKWTKESPLNYWNDKCEGKRLMHVDSYNLTKTLLNKIKELGEEEFYKWYKENKKQLKEKY